MSKATQYEDQGYGVMFSHVAVAKEMLRQDGKSITDDNLYKTIQKLAKEKAESYTPSEELGQNPSSSVSQKFRKLVMPQIFDDDIMKERFPNKAERDAIRIEMTAAINNLVHMVMKHFYGFKMNRQPGVDLTDPTQITSIEYLKKSSKYSPEDISAYNKTVDVYRDLRLLMETYLFHAIRPMLMNMREGIDQALIEMGYDKLTGKQVRSENHKKILLLEYSKIFAVFFKGVRFTDFLLQMRWTTDGTKLIGSRQKRLPGRKKKS